MADQKRRLATLSRLRRVQKLKRDQAAAALALANNGRADAARGESTAVANRTRLDDAFVRRATQAEHPSDLECLADEQAVADEQVAQAARAHAAAHRECATRSAAVAEAERAIAVTDKLTDRTKKALAHAVDRAEQKTIDDLAPTRPKAHP